MTSLEHTLLEIILSLSHSAHPSDSRSFVKAFYEVFLMKSDIVFHEV
jgi:hypothetical protein